MSASTNTDKDVIFKNKYQTDFMRVTQAEDSAGFVRHPGLSSPTQQSHNQHQSALVTSPKAFFGATASLHEQGNVLICPVCKVDYDSVVKRPILLPGCGHTFCSVCVRERSVPCLQCPTCR